MSLIQKLRLSITSSTASPDVEPEVDLDESCGFEIGCGSFKSRRYRASCCQYFATTRWSLLFFSLGAIVQGFIINGHTPAVISTLEKRFELSSTESGLISSCYDIAGALTILFVTYVGGHGHKPIWIGWGIFLVGLSGILFSLPHFTAPEYTFVDMPNLCKNATIEACTISSLKDFRFVFYGAFLLAGVGSSPLYSLTITYLDENVKQRYSSMYNGIFIAMSIAGPGVGFLAGASFLRIYTYPTEEVTITESHENWVGAWWLGSMVIGFIGILTSVTVLLLPRVIPGTEKHRQSRENEIHASAVEDEHDPVFGKRFRDFPKVTLQLFRNPTYVFESLGIAVDSLLIGGMTVFGPKYIETQFGVEASDAGIYFGIMAILGGAVGQLAGAGLISRFDIKVRWMLHICYIAPLLALICSLCYLITCSNTALAGVSSLYHDSFPTLQLTSTCNGGCGCSQGLYNPVCGRDGINYFSPCFAGCLSEVGGVYTNCTCVDATAEVGIPLNLSDLATASSGPCGDEDCSSGWQLIVFCFFNFLIIFFTFFNEAAALQVSLRCVSFNRRSFAIGVQVLIWRILGTVPGPLVVGAIFDSACQYWTESCGTTGSCIVYDNSKLSLRVFLFMAITKAVDILLFLGGLFTYKPIHDALPPDDVTSVGKSTPASSPKKLFANGTDDHLQNGSVLPGEVLTDKNGSPNGNYTNTSFTNNELPITDLE